MKVRVVLILPAKQVGIRTVPVVERALVLYSRYAMVRSWRVVPERKVKVGIVWCLISVGS